MVQVLFDKGKYTRLAVFCDMKVWHGGWKIFTGNSVIGREENARKVGWVLRDDGTAVCPECNPKWKGDK